jgi:16S rRNA processing protein RimM
MPRDRVCVGIIVGAHGVKGAVRVKSFTEEPGDVAAYGPLSDEAGRRSLRLEVIGGTKGAVIARIEGVSDRKGAEALAGTRLYLPRAALPEPEADEYYHADLLGLAAELADGTPLGKVCAVHDFGAGDVIEVERDGGASLLVPFTRQIVPVVDLKGGRLVINPPEGLIEESSAGPAAAPGPKRRGKGRTGGG